MAKHTRKTRIPLILFGEGPTEELFLGHFSKPQCLEGLLLDLLDDLPPRSQQTSDKLKCYFYDQHLGSREQVLKTFKKKRSELFTQALFEDKKTSHAILLQIIKFLNL